MSLGLDPHELTHSLDHLTTPQLMRVLKDDKDAAIRAAESGNPRRIEASNRLYEYNLRTALKDKQVRVDAAGIHESSHHYADFAGWVYDETLTIHGVWLATRSRWAERETPYAHITPHLARGIWLEETNYTILGPDGEPVQPDDGYDSDPSITINVPEPTPAAVETAQALADELKKLGANVIVPSDN